MTKIWRFGRFWNCSPGKTMPSPWSSGCFVPGTSGNNKSIPILLKLKSAQWDSALPVRVRWAPQLGSSVGLLHGSGPSGCWALARGAIWHIPWPRAPREVRSGFFLHPGKRSANRWWFEGSKRPDEMSLGRIDSTGSGDCRHHSEQIHHPKMGDCCRGRCWKWDWKVQKDTPISMFPGWVCFNAVSPVFFRLPSFRHQELGFPWVF